MCIRDSIGVFGPGFFPVKDWYPAVGEASDYMLSMDTRLVLTDEQRAWLNEFKEKYGYDCSPTIAYWAQEFAFLVEALNKAGTLDPEKLRETILSMDYKGLFGGIKYCDKLYCYDEKGNLIAHFQENLYGPDYFFFPLVQWKGGKPIVIWPKQYAQGKLEIPPTLKSAGG